MRENALRLVKENRYDFRRKLGENDLDIPPTTIETLQVNVTLKCNQACLHCHVDSSPKRTEQMSKETIDKCLEILADHPQDKKS
jgi:MoaA/NifB/PqqE/SkfB family radical SAM enzyme